MSTVTPARNPRVHIETLFNHGLTCKEIAELLDLSVKHVQRCIRKMGLREDDIALTGGKWVVTRGGIKVWKEE